MIPSRTQCYPLWDTYNLPEKKRIHCELISKVAYFLGKELITKGIKVHLDLLTASCLLHDIDKAVEKIPGSRHPDTAVRILKEQNLPEVAEVVRTHSLHCILDPKTAPVTWEQKVLYLVDKMVKQELIGVDARFALWYAENLPPQAKAELDASLSLVKKLEMEIFTVTGITDTTHLAKIVRQSQSQYPETSAK